MITDNLAPLFGGGMPGVRFRQGTILTWNAETGANTVDLAGGTLTDVSILNTSEAIALKQGHVVGLIGQGSTWMILGRVTPPGDPNFAASSVAFGGAGASVSNFALSTSATDIVTDTIAVPSWADEAIVLATGNCMLINTRPAIDFGTCQVRIDGIGGGSIQNGFSPFGDASGNYAQSIAASAQRLITSPGSTITVSTALNAQGAAWGIHASNWAHIDAIAVFRSTV